LKFLPVGCCGAPQAGDLDRHSPLVEFRPAYIRRALAALDFEELGVGVIHSHPQGCAPFPSHSDDDMDSYFAEEFERFGNGRPYASLIVSRDSESTRCEILTRFSS
jgi:hypothetical protein